MTSLHLQFQGFYRFVNTNKVKQKCACVQCANRLEKMYKKIGGFCQQSKGGSSEGRKLRRAEARRKLGGSSEGRKIRRADDVSSEGRNVYTEQQQVAKGGQAFEIDYHCKHSYLI